MSGLSKKGTYNYMAPEVYRGNEYGFGVDIYSLGIVLYRLLNKNRLPFLPPAPDPITYHNRESALVKRMSGEAFPQPFYAEGRLAEIVLKACAFSPKDRYSSPAQMRQELEAILYDQEDAELIYPDGDEIALAENQYISHTPNAAPEEFKPDESSKTEAIFSGQAQTPDAMDASRTESVFGRKAVEDGTSATESVFHKKSAKQQSPPPDVIPKKKASKKWLLLPVVFALALVAGGVLYANHQKQLEADRLSQYQQLMTNGTDLCENDPVAAGKIFLDAQALYPDNPAPYTSYAYSLYCANEYEKCVSYIEDDLALGKGYEVDVQNKLSEILGAAYFEMDDYAAAASFFRLSTAGGDITVSAMRDYAVSLGRLGDVSAADEVLQKMFATGADGDVTTYVQAEVDFALENYLEAESGFKTVLDDTEDIVLQKRSLRSLAEVYRACSALVRTNQSPIATPATKEAELLAWGIAEFGLRYDSTIWEMLALAYFEAYHTDSSVTENYLTKAAECFNRVIELGVTKDYLYSNLYTIYYELKDYESAEQALSDFEKQYPNSYMPHALRGMMLITIENSKAQDSRDYGAAKASYVQAGQLIRSDDDATYYQQLESLIHQLEKEGWL